MIITKDDMIIESNIKLSYDILDGLKKILEANGINVKMIEDELVIEDSQKAKNIVNDYVLIKEK